FRDVARPASAHGVGVAVPGPQAGGDRGGDLPGADGGVGQQRRADAVRVLGGALDGDAALHRRGRADAVVAFHAQAAAGQARAVLPRLAQEGQRVARPVPGRVDEDVGVQHGAFAGRQEVHRDPHAGVAGLDVRDPGGVEDAQPLFARDLLLVVPAVQLVDQLQVDDRVVGRAVVVHQRPLHVLGGGEEVVDRPGVEDAVGERAVVGGRVAVLGEHRAHLGAGDRAVQVVGDLGGALPGADRHQPPRVAQPGDAVEQFLAVPDALAAHDPLGQGGLQAGGDHQVAGAARGELVGAAAVPHDHVEVLDRAAGDDGRDADDLGTVFDLVVKGGRGPVEIVVEFRARREHRLVVDEV